MEQRKIGVFICHCGGNISDYVNVKEIAEAVHKTVANNDKAVKLAAEKIRRRLRLEARQKLNKHKPANIGMASRISGVTPADVNVLLIYLKRGFHAAKTEEPT